MSRFIRTTMILAVVVGSLAIASATAGPTDPPFPSRINFPTTGFTAEGVTIWGNNFYVPNLPTGGVLKGDLSTGIYDANWIPASPTTGAAHRGQNGATAGEVDSHGRLWLTGALGTAPSKGYVFVFDATSGTELAAYKVTDATSRLMNDLVLTPTAVWVSDTTAPNGAGTEVQHMMKLPADGSLPPGGEIDATGVPLDLAAGPDFTDIPTPGFISSDGIDVLPNGYILFTSVSGNDGRLIVINPDTWKVTNVTVTTPNEPGRPATLPPLLSGDGITVDGDTVYYPENRAIAAACPAPNANLICPGDIAVIKFDPASNYTTAQVVTRLNNVAGIPPLRSVANLEETPHFVYAITRDAAVGGVTQVYLSKIPKDAPNIEGATIMQTENGPAFTGPVATVLDPAAATATGLAATIDWGDGSPVDIATVTGSAGHFTISGTHNYAFPATGLPTVPNPFVTVTFADGPNGTSNSSVHAAVLVNAPITPTAPAITGVAGTAVTWTSTFTDAGIVGTAANYTAPIVWGDGTANTNGTVTAGPGSGYTVTATHTYTRSGLYAPRITVTDSRGGTGTATGSATISGPAEVPLVVSGLPRTESRARRSATQPPRPSPTRTGRVRRRSTRPRSTGVTAARSRTARSRSIPPRASSR